MTEEKILVLAQKDAFPDVPLKIRWRCNCGSRFDGFLEYNDHVNSCKKRDRYKPKYCSKCGKSVNFDTDLKRYCEHMR